jgi:hypothetical protein
MSERSKNQRGFTLAETIAALFVFLVGIVAVMTLVSDTLRTSYKSAGKLTAIYLAQEGIEIVRNIRDENWINGRNWRSDSLTGCNLAIDVSGATNTTCDYSVDDTVLNPDGYITDFRSGLLANYEDIFLCYYFDDARADASRPVGYIYDHASNPPCRTYLGGVESDYKRTIYLKKISDNELEIRSRIRWKSATSTSGYQEFEIMERLRDWNRQDK